MKILEVYISEPKPLEPEACTSDPGHLRHLQVAEKRQSRDKVKEFSSSSGFYSTGDVGLHSGRETASAGSVCFSEQCTGPQAGGPTSPVSIPELL